MMTFLEAISEVWRRRGETNEQIQARIKSSQAVLPLPQELLNRSLSDDQAKQFIAFISGFFARLDKLSGPDKARFLRELEQQIKNRADSN